MFVIGAGDQRSVMSGLLICHAWFSLRYTCEYKHKHKHNGIESAHNTDIGTCMQNKRFCSNFKHKHKHKHILFYCMEPKMRQLLVLHVCTCSVMLVFWASLPVSCLCLCIYLCHSENQAFC